MSAEGIWKSVGACSVVTVTVGEGGHAALGFGQGSR